MFFVTRNADELTVKRLDANYYSPEFVANQKLVEKFKTVSLDSLRKKDAPIVYGILKPEGGSNGKYRVVKAENFEDMFVDPNKCEEVSKKIYDEFLRSTAIAGDLLVAIGGYVGRPAILQSASQVSANINRHLARLRVDNSIIDSHFLVAVLSCSNGQLILNRQITGTVQAGINLEDLREVAVPVVNSMIQKYIGNKVRQAERLRAWAGRAQEKAVREMPAYKPMISHYEKSSYRVSTDSLLSARLDSSFFHPDHRALDRKMKESGCKYLGKVASSVKPGWNKKSSDSFLYYEIGGLNVSNGTIAPVVTLITEAPSRATTAVKQGDVLVSTVRPNRKNVGFVIEDIQDMPMVATSGFSVLRFESLIEAAFYHAWLRTDDATSQLMRWNSGSAYPAIDEDVPLKILVPEFDVSLRARLGQILLDTHFALLHSAKLINAAKLLVEALIEGQLTEAELSAAEQALQAGNDQLDRRILNRLKTDGIDGQGPALFGDLDELYHLLTQAKED